MATQEHYSLRWNNHQNHILRAFDTLLQTKTLVDVTLVCAETSIRAHKVVLSACSPFFQRVFSETPCKHPVIVLKDFRGWVVQAIVDFMYRGEISVPQERLQTLIQAGESLQVRGLIDHPVAGNTPTPAASPDDFSVIDESMDDIINSQSKLLLPQVFVDTITNHNVTGQPEACTSPMPRRKQARPRRRSGECAPQDLSQSKPCTPAPQTTPTSQVQITPSTSKPSSSPSTTSPSTTTTATTSQNSKTPTTRTTTTPKPNQTDDDEQEQFSEIENEEEEDDEIQESKRKKDNHKDKDTDEDKPVKQEERPTSSLADDEGEIVEDAEPASGDGDGDVEREAEVDQDAEGDDHDGEPDEMVDDEEMEDEEGDDTQKSNEGPENLCTKSTSNNNNNEQQSNNNSSSNRIVLSLRDIRHLNRPSVNTSSNHPPPPPPSSHHHPTEPQLSPVQAHPLNLNNHSSLGHYLNKHDGSRPDREDDDRDDRMDHDGPFMDQMDLSLAHHNLLHNSHAMEHLASLSSKEFKDFKEFSQAQLMNPLPHFGQHPDGHHPNSPINLPHMPSISSLTMTPPHMFGLDSPLGLFPHGMDPGKLYSPLMEMSDPRGGLHPDHPPPPFLKKKIGRAKGQHSAPRGGPPRSWTNSELTEALQHVWNKKMTTSQASRIFGIPYNSLLMYVRGKYGKSLKLEELRKDCISGPPIEMLSRGINNNKGHHNKNIKNENLANMPRSSSSEPDLMSSPNMFNPFPPGFYPDFASGFPGLPLSVLNLLPDRPGGHHGLMTDEDCKSDRSKQSLDDDFQQPLALSREENREMIHQNGQE